MFELFGKRSMRVHAKKSGTPENCRVMSDLLDPDGDAIESWRVFRIMSEFVAGFELLRKYGLAATIFGGARFTKDDPYYQDAEALGCKLAENGFAVITGGGPGIMEGANAGAFNCGGKSVGLNIQLPIEQKFNQSITENASFDFFFSRKVMLAYASEVYIFFPGGYGTLDELFEMLTLVQTEKIDRIPVILYGKEYWEPLVEWMKTSLLKRYKTISKEDLDLFTVVDSVDEAIGCVLRRTKPEIRKERDAAPTSL